MENTTNVFTDGIISDMHPLTTQETQLTDALNATFITYNGNEMIILNDMGNTTIMDSDGQTILLTKGFVPIGIKEHGGILYIASLNKDGKGELGTIPSPQIRIGEPTIIIGKEHSVIEFTDEKNKNLTLPIHLNSTWNDEFNNPLKITDQILTIGDCYKIVFDYDLREFMGYPIISSYTKNGECKYNGLYNATLKSLIANGKEIDAIPTTIYDNGYWFLSPNDLDNSNYLYYPNIPKGKLVTYFTLNLPKNVRLISNDTTGFDEPVTYKYTDNKYYISIKGFTWDSYNGPIRINKFTVESSSSNVQIKEDNVSLIVDELIDKNRAFLKDTETLRNYTDVELTNNPSWYFTIDDSSKDLTAYLTLGLYWDNIKLGIFNIIYNPIYYIADDTKLVPSAHERQWYDATNVDENPYDVLYNASLITDVEKPNVYVHQGFAYNKHGADLFFVPGFVYKSTSDTTYPVAADDAADKDIGFYWQSLYSSLKSDLIKDRITDVIRQGDESIPANLTNVYTASDLTEFLENNSHITDWQQFIDSFYSFVLRKYPNNTGEIQSLDSGIVTVLEYSKQNLSDLVNNDKPGTEYPMKLIDLFMQMCILASDFGYITSYGWEENGHNFTFIPWVNNKSIYTANRRISEKKSALPRLAILESGKILYSTDKEEYIIEIPLFDKNFKIQAGGAFLYKNNGMITVKSSKPMILVLNNKLNPNVSHSKPNKLGTFSINKTEINLSNESNYIQILDTYNKVIPLSENNLLTDSIKINCNLTNNISHTTTNGFALFTNLDLSMDINVPTTGRSDYNVIPLFAWYSDRNGTYTTWDKKIPTVNYEIGWELSNVQENLNTPRTILGNEYGNNQTYNLAPLNSNFKEGWYYVNLNASGYELGYEENGRFQKFTILYNYFIKLQLNPGTLLVHKTSPDGYIRNVGVYYAGKIDKNIIKDGLNEISEITEIAHAICFKEDNQCVSKLYKFKHYPDNPQLKCIGWYSYDNTRKNIKWEGVNHLTVIENVKNYLPVSIDLKEPVEKINGNINNNVTNVSRL